MNPRLGVLAAGALLLGSAAVAATNAVDSQNLAYQRKTTVDAYNQVGRKNPKWDADALECLATFAEMRASKSLSADAQTNFIGALNRVADANCDDPLVRYLYLRFVYGDAHTATENADAFKPASSALMASKYPDIRKFYGARWAYSLSQRADPRDSSLAGLLDDAGTALGSALHDPAMPEKEADAACRFLMEDLWWATPVRWTFYPRLESALANRWKGTSFALLVRGQAYLSHAWEARGLGMAGTVNDQGWKLLEQRLGIAAESLEAAWKLDPTDVRICVEMMRVELGQHQGRSRLETWFQRGMNLNPGGAEVCVEKLEYLRPRWYGSVPEMIAFGRQCTTNTNYTGAASLMLARAHREAAREAQSQEELAAYWRQPKVWRDIQFAFEEFFKRFPEETRFRQDYALYAYTCSQWSEVLKQARMFPYTNYVFFGGVDRFNRIMTTARDKAGKE